MQADAAIDVVRDAKAKAGAVVWRASVHQNDEATATVFADVQHVGPDQIGIDGDCLVSAGDAWREVWYVGDDPSHTQRVI